MKMTSFRLIALLPLLAAGCSAAPKSSTSSSPGVSRNSTGDSIHLVGTFEVRRFALENGLKILVIEDHTSPTFAYQTWFRVGSRDEIPGYTGLAHLFEHMMFKGTTTIPEGQFDKLLESAGAEGENAFTSNDYTAYVQEMPSDKLDLIAKLEADRMVNLVVNDESFKTEREVVQNERRSRVENSPEGLMYQDLFGLAFTKHSYRWPVIGYDVDLARMSAEDARKFYKAWYSPNHATVVVSGDVDPDRVVATIRKHYGFLSPTPTPSQSIDAEPEQVSPRRKTLKLNTQVEKMLIAFRIPGEIHADSAAISMLQMVLSTGKSSRLHRALVETGIASSVYAYDRDGKDPSLFIIGVNLQKGKKSAQAESAILREVSMLARAPIAPAELERARNQLNFAFLEGMAGNSQKANFIGRYETLSDEGFEAGLRIFKEAMAVTPDQIRQAAVKYLEPKSRTVIVGVPK